MTKREEAEQAMRLGPIVATEAERVDLLREAINEALEEAARITDEFDEVGGACSDYIRALKKERT